MDFNSGGKKVIERLVEAYGFTTRQALCDHLGVSKSTMATRYMRDIFPADWVLQCAIDTDASIIWLATGEGNCKENIKKDVVKIPQKIIENGMLIEKELISIQKDFIINNLKDPVIVKEADRIYICDGSLKKIEDGNWLVQIDDHYSIRMITMLPGKRLRVANEATHFECKASELNFIYKAVKIVKNI